MTNPNLWNQLLIWPILNVLIAFYKLFEWLHVPGPLGLAIILLTIVIRLVLYPLTKAQLTSAKKMANLKPHLDALNAKHKDNKQALQQAQLDLYKQHGVNPAAGCLPLLLQFPVLIALYNVFYQVLGASGSKGNIVLDTNIQQITSIINQVVYSPVLKLSTLDLSFFGTSLTVRPNQWQSHGVWLLAIPIITAGLQWWQAKLMMPMSVGNSKSEALNSKQIQKSNDQKEKPAEDTAMEMQKQMAIISPLMFGYLSLQFPLGLALYWNVFGLFGIMQQLLVNRQNKQISQ